MAKINSTKLFEIIGIFEEMSIFYKLIGDKIREKAYVQATNTLMEKLLTNDLVLKDILFNSEYIGRRLSLHILSILKTGTYYEYKKFKNDPKLQSLLELQNVYGIGPVMAAKLIKKSVDSLAKLKKIKQTFSAPIQLGITYYKDLSQTIDKKTINHVTNEIEKVAASHNTEALLCGSTRRGLEPNDLDYLFVGDSVSIATIMNDLYKTKFSLKGILASGSTKYMAIIKDNVTGKIFRIDIRLIGKKSKYAAMVYFTGPKYFNTWMRSQAIAKGLLLNEYGLFKNTTSIEIKSEKDIFTHLNIKYLTPEKRTKFWEYL